MNSSALPRLISISLLIMILALSWAEVAIPSAQAADLMDLYNRALEFDPAYQAARLERMVAGESLREAQAGLKPQLSASLEASKVYQDIKTSDNFLYQEGSSDFFNKRYSISLTQPLWHPEVNDRLKQAKVEVRQATAQFAAAEQDLIFRLAQAHFDHLAARDNLEFASTERRAIQQQLQESEERLDSGLGSLTDVHEARARFALAQAAEIAGRDALEESRQAIAEITGEVPEAMLRLSETFPLVDPDRPEVEAWVEAARFQNPAIVALEATVEIAEREIQVQRSAYKPRLDFTATHDNSDSGGTSLGSGEGNEIQSTDLAVRLGIPIYSGGRFSALVRAASLRHQGAIQELERARRSVERETRTSFQGVVSGITRVQALSQSVFSQESVLSAREEGLRSGVNTGRDVLDARRDLFFAKRDLAQARYLYILNSLKLKQSAGILGGTDLRQINAHLQ